MQLIANSKTVHFGSRSCLNIDIAGGLTSYFCHAIMQYVKRLKRLLETLPLAIAIIQTHEPISQLFVCSVCVNNFFEVYTFWKSFSLLALLFVKVFIASQTKC